MKVLWFTNTPCGATRILTGSNVTGGGWLYTLSKAMSLLPDIDLHIAFYWGVKIDSFKHEGITYHPVLAEGEGRGYTRAVNRFRLIYGIDSSNVQIERLLTVINEISPNVIHIHGSEENFGLISERIDSANVVLSIQGMMSPLYEKYYSGISKHESLKGDNFIKWLKCRNTEQEERCFKKKSEIEKRIFNNINNIIGRTFWDRRCSLSLNPNRKYFEVGEILREEFYKTAWEHTKHGKCIIATTISNGIYKGLESVYKVAKILKDAGFTFEWNVIGVDESSSYAKLISNIYGIKASEVCINLLGRKNASEMVEIMKSSDIYVQVSHIENSPNSLCEAMVMGMPIIATFAGGTESILTNNIDGWLVQDGDSYVMSGSIMELYANQELSVKFANNAKEKARKRHDPELILNQLITVYNTIKKDDRSVRL